MSEEFIKMMAKNAEEVRLLWQKIEILTKALEYYDNDANWFKKWGHKDNWAIEGSGDTATKALAETK